MRVIFLEEKIIVDKESIEEARKCVKNAREILLKTFKYNVDEMFYPTKYLQVYKQVSIYDGITVHRLVHFNEWKCRFEFVLAPHININGVTIRFDTDDGEEYKKLREFVTRTLGKNADYIEVSHNFLKACVGDNTYFYDFNRNIWIQRDEKMFATTSYQEGSEVVDVSEIFGNKIDNNGGYGRIPL